MDKFSVLIPSYHEKETLLNLVKTLLKDRISNQIEKIVVVSPDKDIVLPKSRKIFLIREQKRKGKFYAIRSGLKKINSKIVVMLSSDLKMRKDFLSYLLKHFTNRKVGMVVGRPIADKNSKIYQFAKVIWSLHNLLCLKEPKGTEICAFRKFDDIFPKVSADEVYIEYAIRRSGQKIIYEPSAYGYTKVPNSLFALFLQRKRSFNGHLQIAKKYNFKTSSMKFSMLLKILSTFLFTKFSVKKLAIILVLIIIELLARFAAAIEFFLFKKIQTIW